MLVTLEEDRAVQAVRAVCDHLRRTCLSWDAAEHFQPVTPGAAVPAARERDRPATGPVCVLERGDDVRGGAASTDAERDVSGSQQRPELLLEDALVAVVVRIRGE